MSHFFIQKYLFFDLFSLYYQNKQKMKRTTNNNKLSKEIEERKRKLLAYAKKNSENAGNDGDTEQKPKENATKEGYWDWSNTLDINNI